MKKSNQTIGFHTPLLTKSVLRELNRYTNHEWICSSWGNDETDSVFSESCKMYVYLTNDNIDTFLIQDTNQNQLFESGEFREILTFINNQQ